MKFYVEPSASRPGYYYIVKIDPLHPNAEFCEEGNIKIIIDNLDEDISGVSQEDLALFYTRLESIIVRYLPVTFNGRLL